LKNFHTRADRAVEKEPPMNFLEKSPSSQPGWKKRRMKQSERLRELPGRQPLRAAASLVMNSQKGPPGGSGDFFYIDSGCGGNDDNQGGDDP